MGEMRIMASVSRPGDGLAQVDVDLPLPKSWNPDAVAAVLPAVTDSMVALLQAWMQPDGEVVFEGGES